MPFARLSAALCLLLTACGGAGTFDTPPQDYAAPFPAPVGTPMPAAPLPPVEGALVERTPDLCHASDFQHLVGLPGSVVETAPIGREFRVVPEGGIVTQEYNPGRLNFMLDANSVVSRIECG